MTISTEIRKAGPFIGDGVATVFPFAFKVFEEDYTYVLRKNTATGALSTLVLGSQYDVTLNADQENVPGGVIILSSPLPVGFELTVTSDIPYTQPAELNNAGGFYPKIVTDAFDRTVALIQQLRQLILDNGNIGLPGPAGPPGPPGSLSAREFGGGYESPIANNEVLLRYKTLAPFTIAANLADWTVGVFGGNPTSAFVLTVADNGTTIGTISISTAGAVTLATVGGTAKAIDAGDTITITAPADATTAGPSLTLAITGKGNS